MSSIWMYPWDLEGGDPEQLADRLLELGLHGCRLAIKYHGGRMVLPRGRTRRVRELDPAGVYFEPDPVRYRTLRLQPRRCAESALVPRFIEACAAAGLRVDAWTVICHDDLLGLQNPDCCIRNVFGDRYSYALCPSHPEVREYARVLCADIASRPGVAGIDAEALGFMGYRHHSLHDKSGIPLTEEAEWLLSICVCEACRDNIGAVIDEAAVRARARLQAYFNDPQPMVGDLRQALEAAIGEETLAALLRRRGRVVSSLAEAVRAELGGARLNLRYSPDPLFVGGKSVLDPADLATSADSVTLSFFGATLDQVREELRLLPPRQERPLPMEGGIVFHHPDCTSEQELRMRRALLFDAGLDGISFYSLGLASVTQLRWLAATIGPGAGQGAASASISTRGPT